MYEPRHYRVAAGSDDLVAFEVIVAETDLQVLAERELAREAYRLVHAVRRDIEDYIRAHPRFAESFVPLPVEPDASQVIALMAEAAAATGVGPMAAVAGTVAEYVAVGLSRHSNEVIVENGGDVYLCGNTDRVLGLWRGAGGERDVGISVSGSALPLAVATSSGRIGHSVSFGDTDTATVLARSGALADAAATAVANRVRSPGDLDRAVEWVRGVEGLLGTVISIDGSVAAWGDVRLVPVGIE